MKKLAFALIAIGIIFGTSRGIYRYFSGIDYLNTVYYNWDLATKASTIEQKSKYITAFVETLETQNLQGTNANLLNVTPASGFDENFLAFQSLRQRLDNIKTMDENGFAYQTAIQQITDQEQGEAHEMLCVFKECWYREHYYTLWNEPLRWAFVVLQVLLVASGLVILAKEY